MIRVRALAVASFRQLLAGKRLVVLAALAATSVLILWASAVDSPADAASDLRSAVLSLVLPLLVPLVSLTFGAAVLGDDLRDGTAPVFWLKPLARSGIVAGKLAAAASAALAIVVPTILAAHMLVGGLGAGRLAAAAVVAAIAGAAAYSALGLVLSLVTERALVLGLAYVVFWEGIAVPFAPALRSSSIRAWEEGLFERSLAHEAAWGPTVSPLVFVLAAFLLAWRRFERMDLE